MDHTQSIIILSAVAQGQIMLIKYNGTHRLLKAAKLTTMQHHNVQHVVTICETTPEKCSTLTLEKGDWKANGEEKGEATANLLVGVLPFTEAARSCIWKLPPLLATEGG